MIREGVELELAEIVRREPIHIEVSAVLDDCTGVTYSASISWNYDEEERVYSTQCHAYDKSTLEQSSRP